MAIDYVRQVIEQTLEQEHSKYPTKYFGGKNQVNLMSFYEQLQEEYEVNRFTEVYRDLVNEQNRSGLIMNGTIVAPENPQIMNINSATIIPLTFTTSFRVALKDRDEAIKTITHMMDILRGRKRDIAEFDNGSLFMVGTIANDVLGTPTVKSGDYIGNFISGQINGQDMEELANSLAQKGITMDLNVDDYVYWSYNNKLYAVIRTYKYIQIDEAKVSSFTYEQSGNKVTVDGVVSFSSYSNNYTSIPSYVYDGFYAYVLFSDGTHTHLKKVKVNVSQENVSLSQGIISGTGYFAEVFNDNALTWSSLNVEMDEIPDGYEMVENNETYPFVELPPQHTSFTKNKVSISFDSIRIDEPKTLNAEEYCTISFGGSATVVSENVALGNDLTKLGIKKYKVKAQTDVSITDSYHWLEPLEMPSGLGISGEISQLASHNFIQNKHNDGINPTFNYSFVLTKDEPLIYQWWKYARYGTLGTYNAQTPYNDGVTPNMLYSIEEIWSSWGQVEVFSFYAKTTENVDIENTESDALSIKLTFELQKE